MRMTERQFSEVERALFVIGDARARTGKAVRAMVLDHADSHVVDALRKAERALGAACRDLEIETYYAVPATEVEPARRKSLQNAGRAPRDGG
jgi:hypothetical protein